MPHCGSSRHGAEFSAAMRRVKQIRQGFRPALRAFAVTLKVFGQKWLRTYGVCQGHRQRHDRLQPTPTYLLKQLQCGSNVLRHATRISKVSSEGSSSLNEELKGVQQGGYKCPRSETGPPCCTLVLVDRIIECTSVWLESNRSLNLDFPCPAKQRNLEIIKRRGSWSF